MKIKIYSDGAEIDKMLEDYNSGIVSGFTTNPTLMKVGGVTDYLGFAKEVLSQIKDLPISFEVFSDNIDEMEKQAYKLRDLAENVYVKIPIQNTKGESTSRIIKSLSSKGVKLNITAIFSENQIFQFMNLLIMDGLMAQKLFIKIFIKYSQENILLLVRIKMMKIL